jgi:hypothetical protein
MSEVKMKLAVPIYNEYSLRKALRPDDVLEEKPWQTREFVVFDPHSNLITFFENID